MVYSVWRTKYIYDKNRTGSIKCVVSKQQQQNKKSKEEKEIWNKHRVTE